MYIYIINFILMIFYWFVFLHKRNDKKAFLFFTFLTMALILGLRGARVGEDTAMYLKIAEQSHRLSWLDVLKDFPRTTWFIDADGYHHKIETGYLLLNKFIMLFSGNAQFVLILVSLLTCFSFARFIYDQADDRVFLMTYLLMFESIYMISFTLVRQVLALAIILNAYRYIRARNYKMVALLYAAGFLIHQSSIILLLLVPLCFIQQKQKVIKYIALAALLLPLNVSLLQIITTRFFPAYALYLKVSYWEPKFNGVMVLWGLVVVVAVVMYRCRILNTEEFVPFACVLIALSFEMLGLRFSAVSRLAIYFKAFLPLFFLNAVRCFPEQRRKYYILILLFIVTMSYVSYSRSPARIYSFFWL